MYSSHSAQIQSQKSSVSSLMCKRRQLICFSQLFRREDISEHWISQWQWQTCLAHVHCYKSETMSESIKHCSSVTCSQLSPWRLQSVFPDRCPFLSMAVGFQLFTLRLSKLQDNQVPSLPWTILDLKNFSSTLRTSSFNLSYNMCSLDFFLHLHDHWQGGI